MIVRLCVLTLLVLIPWCAHSQQKGNPAMPCYRALPDDPRFAPIRQKVALGPVTDERHDLTSISERASRQEASAIATWRDAREACHRLEADYFATRDAGIQALARESFAAVQALINELQSGKLSYGEFSRRRTAEYERLMRKVEEIRRSILPAKPPPRPNPNS